MKHNAIAALAALIALLLPAAGCDKNDDKAPSSQGKVNCVYFSNHTVREQFDPATGHWTTFEETVNQHDVTQDSEAMRSTSDRLYEIEYAQ